MEIKVVSVEMLETGFHRVFTEEMKRISLFSKKQKFAEEYARSRDFLWYRLPAFRFVGILRNDELETAYQKYLYDQTSRKQ